MQRIAIVGAGTMGHGIAQVCAMAGLTVRLTDADPAGLERGLAQVRATLDQSLAKGHVTADVHDRALAHLAPAASLAEAVADADLVVEAIPERLDLKQHLFGEVERHAPPACIFGTNTSSLSIAAIASHLADPGRLIGTHFFNPVPRMPLLEIVHGPSTRPDVLEAVRAFGKTIGKDCIVVKDSPGFATSRLGVCLGMEAIRMVEAGVASAEDIDRAMELGYRHPVGPLKLTDLVGLDVRMAIGSYLAHALDNAAFEPPELMKSMVREGKLGKKSGQGFYRW